MYCLRSPRTDPLRSFESDPPLKATRGHPLAVALDRFDADYAGEPQRVCCDVPLCCTRCNYGASRAWFACPECDRRCALIYFGATGGRFGCRSCSRVAYTSQSETRIDRLHRKLQKLENRMAGGVEHWDWRRPKGMHQITYERTVERYLAIVEAQDLEIEHRLTRMFPTSIW